MHAVCVSGSGCADATPLRRLPGTLAVPFWNSANAVSDDTVVPLGAPAGVSAEGRPKEVHAIMSSTWHEASSRDRSAWQSGGQKVAVACRHGYGVVITPPAETTTASLAADWLTRTTWSNASLQAAPAYGAAAASMTSAQSLAEAGSDLPRPTMYR